MRIFKGLENIHAVIDRHETEWRKEQGELVDEEPKELSVEETVRRRLTHSSSSPKAGKFSADRFLGEPAAKPEPSQESEQEQEEGGAEFVNVIKQQEDHAHSWLYKEVTKAVKDAIGNNKNTKVIAIFIPVVQNGKEFEDLPVNESVTLSPVSEKDINLTSEDLGVTKSEEPSAPEEISSDDFNLFPPAQEHPDPELAEAIETMAKKFVENLEAEKEQEQEQEEFSEDAEIIKDVEEEAAEEEQEQEAEEVDMGQPMEFDTVEEIAPEVEEPEEEKNPGLPLQFKESDSFPYSFPEKENEDPEHPSSEEETSQQEEEQDLLPLPEDMPALEGLDDEEIFDDSVFEFKDTGDEDEEENAQDESEREHITL